MAHIRLYSITPDGKQAILALIEPGELFGEPALVGSDAREEFAQSVGTSRSWRLRVMRWNSKSHRTSQQASG
jgi:CRP-like cAMP-binding protein